MLHHVIPYASLLLETYLAYFQVLLAMLRDVVGVMAELTSKGPKARRSGVVIDEDILGESEIVTFFLEDDDKKREYLFRKQKSTKEKYPAEACLFKGRPNCYASRVE
ncbi:hypothetical protein M7I_6082 [Glarea lozoyensis 74030]|uniref:Uncharacterized protein n=1 Tax=Glarea lozoyensis (strain ATCC 74030 / MF5533) TaxID=1104152 RepID=H0ETL8_GLAL7|nr:hypothetical protein M7I_6082 [Glarea lozoyensis 74030]